MILLQTQSFLSDSQTFLGVICSILVLGIFINQKEDSNLLRQLSLFSQKKKKRYLKKEYESLSSSKNMNDSIQEADKGKYAECKTLLEKVISGISEEIKRLTDKEHNPNTGANDRLKIQEQIRSHNKMLMQARLYRTEMDIEGSATLTRYFLSEIDIDREFEEYRHNTTPLLAAFYSLIYGLFLFCSDQVIIAFENLAGWMLGIIFMLTSISFVYWGAIWIKFWRMDHILKPDDEPDYDRAKLPYNIERHLGRPGSCRFYWTSALILTFFFAISIFISTLAKTPILQQMIVYGFGTTMPIIVFGILMLINYNTCESPYEMMIKHFTIFLLISVAYVTVAMLLSDLRPEEWHLTSTYGNSFVIWLRFATEIFILLNGLVVACWLPVLSTGRHAKRSFKAIKRDENQFRKYFRARNKKVRKFLDSVPSRFK